MNCFIAAYRLSNSDAGLNAIGSTALIRLSSEIHTLCILQGLSLLSTWCFLIIPHLAFRLPCGNGQLHQALEISSPVRIESAPCCLPPHLLVQVSCKQKNPAAAAVMHRSLEYALSCRHSCLHDRADRCRQLSMMSALSSANSAPPQSVQPSANLTKLQQNNFGLPN